jgi:hypothetical protein
MTGEDHGKYRDGSLLSVHRLLLLYSNARLYPLSLLLLATSPGGVDCSDNFTGSLAGHSIRRSKSGPRQAPRPYVEVFFFQPFR